MFYLKPNTLFTGQDVVYLPSCHSTNDYANQLLGSNITEGTVVITAEQTVGRGQRGNSWEAQPHLNLTFSVVWIPTFLNLSKQFYLSMTVSLGISDFVQEYLHKDQVFIKWPNDLYVKHKKLGGILIENQLQGHRIRYSVIGIGLNVNQTSFKEPKAISMSKITQKKYVLNDLLEKLLVKLESRYFQLRNEKYDLLNMNYFEKMYRYQEKHLFQDEQGVFQGEIIGLDASGRLAVARQHKIQYYGFQEIKFL